MSRRANNELDRTALGRLAVDPGLCGTCAHLRLMTSPRSVFVRCGRAEDDPAYPRYPPLPVRFCRGYEEGTEEGAPERA